MLDQIAEGQVADVLKVVLRRARRGDLKACGIIRSRCWPARKGGPVRFPMPALDTPADLPGALASVAMAVSEGILSPDEAASIAAVLNAQMRAVEIAELDARLEELERKAGNP
jgi:hypothetical protein